MADPLGMLQAALTAEANSPAQSDILTSLRSTLEAAPAPIPILVSTLVSNIAGGGDSLLRTWVVDLLCFGICTTSLHVDQRTQLALSTLPTLSQLLDDASPAIVKVAIQALTGAYPLVFRQLCISRSNPAAWETMTSAKSRILDIVRTPEGILPTAVRLAAIKFAQRAVVIQSRATANSAPADPRRRQQQAAASDPNDASLALCPTNHPFMSPPKLEQEGARMSEFLLGQLFQTRDVATFSALVNSYAGLIKMRPGTVHTIVSALKAWTPSSLQEAGAGAVKSAEKSVRILLNHIHRNPAYGSLHPMVSEALSIQAARMEKAHQEEKLRRAGKRSASESGRPDAKRAKLEPAPAAVPDNGSASFLAAFDFTTLPASLITELVIANLGAFSDQALAALVAKFRADKGLPGPPAPAAATVAARSTTPPGSPPPALKAAYAQARAHGQNAAAPSAPRSTSLPTGPRAEREKKEVTPRPPPEPVDPLAVDLDQNELEFEPDALNRELGPGRDADDVVPPTAPRRMRQATGEADAGDVDMDVSDDEAAVADAAAAADIDFTSIVGPGGVALPAPPKLGEDEKLALVKDAVSRVWDGAAATDAVAGAVQGPELWMLLGVRMITRVAAMPLESGKEKKEEVTSGKSEKPERAASKEEDGEDSVQPGTKREVDDAEDGADDSTATPAAVEKLYERQDALRRTLCDYIIADFSGRLALATTWMNEEWYNDRVHMKFMKEERWRPNYDIWLAQLVSAYETMLDDGRPEAGTQRSFAKFLLDLPAVPPDVMDLLRDLCVEGGSPNRVAVGFQTLRGFVIQRPSLRDDALKVLLELTTHPERKTRGAAINTVKLWVPAVHPMNETVQKVALAIMRRLTRRDERNENGAPSADVEMHSSEAAGPEVAGGAAAGQEAPPRARESSGEAVAINEPAAPSHPMEGIEEGEEQEEVIQTPYLPEHVSGEGAELKSQVLQHVELLFALSVKVPELLDEIFDAFGQMEPAVQGVVQELITPLIRSLGPTHSRLLTLLRTFPPRAEGLALRVLQIFTESGRPSVQLVVIVKGLVAERADLREGALAARFLIPVIGEMDKADVIRYLPRIVSMLNGQPEPKAIVKSVFSSIVAQPPQTFGMASSNAPRLRHPEMLTPAELMVMLHESEKDIGLQSAKEAITICFSMTDIFRSEILAVVIQQIMDEPVLPVLFLRTVIQAVTTYKSLVPFVATTLLSRLITKKIWTNAPLWEGFVRCAKVTAPISFGALLQLPKDQLRELVGKQPSLKAGLRDYVTKKATNKTRVAGFLDIFGEGSENVPTPNGTATPPAPGVVVGNGATAASPMDVSDAATPLTPLTPQTQATSQMDGVEPAPP
ncbi:Symplekin tight junction protein C terminal-domain-containing protein [Schizophyllum amplum]|uniref:Symplekin tight junction protein C terminal-domain-containing protein n=1 Tax=Schizophyllum amplum TaxID=97359 RepID=A0A550C7D9_9AGAR|nr:Symplekin tight junction protein C terminal-domain-containing protein [Auriculariopsis ampla]